MTSKGLCNSLAGASIPDSDSLVIRPRDNLLPIWREGNRGHPAIMTLKGLSNSLAGDSIPDSDSLVKGP